MRVHGSSALPALIYLPGIHGDWTLVGSFRAALAGRVRFIEFTYPRRPGWSLDEYAAAIESALRDAGVTSGWVLGESFGSQPAWQLVARQLAGNGALSIEGLILAGGFVKHPWPWGARFLRWLTERTPRWLLRGMLGGLERLAGWRHRHAPETRRDVAEFVRNRLHSDDPAAWCHRYTLIAGADLRPVARQFRGPVFQLTGALDPIVPAPLVRRWLRRHCPGFRGSRTVWFADHNVLGTAPAASAAIIATWMADAHRREAAEAPA
jgi:pimeloyl-ACP methyl ester carboxylesterase